MKNSLDNKVINLGDFGGHAMLEQMHQQGILDKRGHGENAEYKLSDDFMEAMDKNLYKHTGMTREEATASGMSSDDIFALSFSQAG